VGDWSIIVRVGCDGTEVHISMHPHAKICELHSKVQAACGVDGKLWPVSTMVDCDEATPLCFDSTMQECGLFHKTVVWLERQDGFSADRDALIAVRESCMMTYSIPSSWSHLESLLSPEHLLTCRSVNVHNDRVTELRLSKCCLIGNVVHFRWYPPQFMQCDWSRWNSKGNRKFASVTAIVFES
jgi:hypothetical protein